MRKIISAILSAIVLSISLCGCEGKTSNENYFGGKGEIFKLGVILQDETNFYFGRDTLYKFNTETEIASAACQIPGCTHSKSEPNCKANLNDTDMYIVFNGRLINLVNERTYGADGSASDEGYLYLCEENKQVFKNVYPESFTDEQKKSHSCDIFTGIPLGDAYLALFCSGFTYILDTDFNIKFTLFDAGSRAGEIYLYDNEIYYINNLYRLMKLDKETGETTAVDLDSMRITEAELDGDTLWFSNGEQALCSYDFKTGEVKEHAKSAVRLNLFGKYIDYLKPSYSADVIAEHRLFNIETGEDKVWGEADEINNLYFCVDGNYYCFTRFPEARLIRYSPDLSEVAKVYSLSE